MGNPAPVPRKTPAHYIDNGGIAGHPEIRASPGKAQGHHADERAANSIQRERFADYTRIGAKLANPRSVAKDGHGRRAGLVVRGFKAAAKKRRHTEHLERAGRDVVGGQIAVVLPGVVDHIDFAISDESVEDAVLLHVLV